MKQVDAIAIVREATKALEQTLAAIRGLLDTAEASLSTTPAMTPPRYVTRKQAKTLLGLETRAFNRAGKAIGFRKPGRELLLPSDELVAWVEAHPVKVEDVPTNEDAPLDFEDFRRSVQRRKAG